LGLTAALHLTKTAITALVLTLNQLKPGAALRSGLLLSQGGEFAFVLFGLAQTHGLMPVAQVRK
jgi:glutathione-regulated potassium-efflux system ancillary protein KefC